MLNGVKPVHARTAPLVLRKVLSTLALALPAGPENYVMSKWCLAKTLLSEKE